MARVGVITKYQLFAKHFDTMHQYFPNDDIVLYYNANESSTMKLLDAAERDGCAALVTGAFTYEVSIPAILGK